MSVAIDYIEFTSAVPEESQAFFESAFGWRFTAYGPDYAAFDRVGVDGGIARQGDAPQPALVILYAEDLDAAQAAVEAARGVITRPQFDFPGGRRFHFREPGGTELAVWSAPGPDGHGAG